jgi:hypothetical protein
VGRYVNIKYGPAMQRFLETGHCMAGLLQKACFSEIKLAESVDKRALGACVPLSTEGREGL